MKRIGCLTLVICSAAVASIVAPSNIDPDHKFSWNENRGWMNSRVGRTVRQTRNRAQNSCFFLESGGSFGYDCGFNSDNWAMSVSGGPNNETRIVAKFS